MSRDVEALSQGERMAEWRNEISKYVVGRYLGRPIP